MKLKHVLGIDVGGSGIKGAVINTKTGEPVTERFRIPTPPPARPEQVIGVIGQIVKHFEWQGAIGIGFPAVIQNGIARTAANVDKSFIGTNIESAVMAQINCPVRVINDADAAGVAEMKFGAGKDNKGLVLLVTVGTGLGTVLFSQGKLVPNTEFGHIIMPNGKEAELYSSDNARQRDDLSWKEWACRFNEYLMYMESLLWPNLIIIGGGVSKNEEKFLRYLTLHTPVASAQLQNHAGIIGAAVAAKKLIENSIVYKT